MRHLRTIANFPTFLICSRQPRRNTPVLFPLSSTPPFLNRKGLSFIRSSTIYLSNTAKLASEQDPAGQAPTSPGSQFHRPILQSMPDNRQQSFDEIYGPPENFLEIEVRFPAEGGGEGGGEGSKLLPLFFYYHA